MSVIKRCSLVPQFSFRDVTDISPDFLTKAGIKFFMVDLDNTIAAYDESSLSDDVSRWAAGMKKSGVELFIVSNSLRKNRVKALAESLAVSYIMGARKPSPKGLLRAIASANAVIGESALVGDQVFTDVLAANRAGIISLVVRPRRFTNPFLTLRYAFEAPFRAMCKNKM